MQGERISYSLVVSADKLLIVTLAWTGLEGFEGGWGGRK